MIKAILLDQNGKEIFVLEIPNTSRFRPQNGYCHNGHGVYTKKLGDPRTISEKEEEKLRVEKERLEQLEAVKKEQERKNQEILRAIEDAKPKDLNLERNLESQQDQSSKSFGPLIRDPDEIQTLTFVMFDRVSMNEWRKNLNYRAYNFNTKKDIFLTVIFKKKIGLPQVDNETSWGQVELWESEGSVKLFRHKNRTLIPDYVLQQAIGQPKTQQTEEEICSE